MYIQFDVIADSHFNPSQVPKWFTYSISYIRDFFRIVINCLWWFLNLTRRLLCIQPPTPSPLPWQSFPHRLYFSSCFWPMVFEILALAITNLIRLVMGEDNLHLMRPVTLPISCRYLSTQSTMSSPCLYFNCQLCNEETWRNNGFNNHKTVMTTDRI